MPTGSTRRVKPSAHRGVLPWTSSDRRPLRVAHTAPDPPGRGARAPPVRRGGALVVQAAERTLRWRTRTPAQRGHRPRRSRGRTRGTPARRDTGRTGEGASAPLRPQDRRRELALHQRVLDAATPITSPCRVVGRDGRTGRAGCGVRSTASRTLVGPSVGDSRSIGDRIGRRSGERRGNDSPRESG